MGAAVGGLMVAAAACERASTPAPAGPIPPAAGAPVALSVGPISFFADHCARCHGSYGSNYGEALSALGDDELARVVDEMIVGPGMAELPPRDTLAQVAYHRSLVDGRPFVAVTARDGPSIAGEVTPGAAIELMVDARRVGATVNGHEWWAVLPADAAGSPVIVEARIGDAVTTIETGRAAYSHSEP